MLFSHQNNKHLFCACTFILAIFSSVSLAQQIIFQDSFDQNSQQWTGLQFKNSMGWLINTSSKKHSGRFSVLKKELPAISDSDALQIDLKIDGISAVDPNELATGAARIFLTPVPMSSFPEPYSLKHAMWFMIDYHNGKPVTIGLYAKNNDKAFGKMLYRAKLTANDMPLTVSLQFSTKNYRIDFDRDLTTAKGARSGEVSLLASAWEKGTRFGMRPVNYQDGQALQLKVDLFRACKAKLINNKSQTSESAQTSISVEPIYLSVDPSITRSIDGHDHVPNIFGVTVNGDTGGDAIDWIKPLNLNSARTFLWPLDYWKHPKDFTKFPRTPGAAAQYGGKAISGDALQKEYDKFYKQDFASLMHDWGQQKVPTTPSGQPRQLSLFYQWGLTNNLVFHTQLDGSALRHLDQLHTYYAAYLDMIGTFAPWAERTYVQLSNEPNYNWFSWEYDSAKQAAQAWVKQFNALDSELRQSHPQTRLLGPCLASSAMFSWDGWSNWSKTVLSSVQYPMEQWNYHCYNVPAYTHLAWIQMLHAQADTLQRPRPRTIVTEMNYALNDNRPQTKHKRFQWWAEQLFVGLENPDKFDIFNYFLLGYRPMNKNNILSKEKGHAWQPNDIYWLYWAMSNLRGRAVYLKPLLDSQIKMFASAPKPDQLAVCLFNDSSQTRSITIDPKMTVKPISISLRTAGFNDKLVIEHQEQTLPLDQAPAIMLPPGHVALLHWQLERPLAPSQSVENKVFYSPTVSKVFDKNLTLHIPVKQLPVDNQTATLKFAVTSDDLLMANGLTLSFNGKDMPIYWNEAPKQVQRDQRNVWWMQLPIDSNQIKSNNVIELKNLDTQYRLMFASIQYQQHPNGTIAQSVRKQSHHSGIKASVQPIGSMMTGDIRPFELTINNTSDQKKTYVAKLTLPENLKMIKEPADWKIDLAAGQTLSLHGLLKAHAVIKPLKVQWHVDIADRNNHHRTLPQSTMLYAKLQIPQQTQSPQIDGKLDEWQQIEPFVDFKDKAVTAKGWLTWQGSNLILAMDVQTGLFPRAAEEVGNFWMNDCIEIFLDLGNQKNRQYDKDDYQLFICPLGIGGGAAVGGKVLREQRGDFVESAGIVLDPAIQTASQLTESGYQIEAIIPMEKIHVSNWQGKSGQRIGINLSVSKPKSATSRLWSQSIMGLEHKYNGKPNKWPMAVMQ